MDASTPTRDDDLEAFAYAAAQYCSGCRAVTAVLFADDGANVLAVKLDNGLHTLAVETVFGRTPLRLALANRVDWSPLPVGPLSLSWALTVVDPNRPAWFLVRRIHEDRTWTRIPPEQAPWFALSTAAGLRTSFAGRPLQLRMATRPELFSTPADVPDPSTGDDGLL